METQRAASFIVYGGCGILPINSRHLSSKTPKQPHKSGDFTLKYQKNGKINKMLDNGNNIMKAITLFGKMLSFSRLKLHTDDLTAIQNELSVVLKENVSVPVG